MKTPETKWPVGWPPPSSLTETWWREIKESLAERGVDLDASDSFSEAQWREVKETFAKRGLDFDALRTPQRHPPTRRAVSAPKNIADVIAPYAVSEAQWGEIKESLAERGVDLDAETVDEPFGPREWWGWHDYIPAQRPLREVLQQWMYIVKIGRGVKAQTPKQYAAKLGDEVAALEKALAIIDPTHVGPGLPTDDELEARINRRHALRAAMTLEIAERRQYIAKLEAKGSRSKDNARTASSDYWDILEELWLKVTGSAGPKRRQRLRRFLLACTPPDLFPDMTAQKLGQKLDSFKDNFFKSR